MWISPDHTWTWKDQDDYDTAIAEGLVDASTRRHLEREADQILADLRSGKDPFTEEFSSFHPNSEWPLPVLPISHAWNGSAWTLPIGRRAETASH